MENSTSESPGCAGCRPQQPAPSKQSARGGRGLLVWFLLNNYKYLRKIRHTTSQSGFFVFRHRSLSVICTQPPLPQKTAEAGTAPSLLLLLWASSWAPSSPHR